MIWFRNKKKRSNSHKIIAAERTPVLKSSLLRYVWGLIIVTLFCRDVVWRENFSGVFCVMVGCKED
jgi:hypothetical protein